MDKEEAKEILKTSKIFDVEMLPIYNLKDYTEAIETVLTALDNSIPKQVIEKKIEWLKENILNNDYASENDKDIAEYQVNILQYLLEGK